MLSASTFDPTADHVAPASVLLNTERKGLLLMSGVIRIWYRLVPTRKGPYLPGASADCVAVETVTGKGKR